LRAFLFDNNLLFDYAKACDSCGHGRISLRQDKTRCDGQRWRCTNRKCNVHIPLRKDSFFSHSHLSLAQIVQVIYYWTYKYPQHIVEHETGISAPTIVDFYNFCREVCCVVVEEESEPIGGPGKVVEVDESKFGKRKYHRGRRVDGVWVFGGIERNSSPPKCFFEVVPDRSAETLIALIKKWILPGTTVASDCWKGYSSLEAEGYVHQTVNHSITFVSDSGVHTNTIESRWNSLKKSLPKFGTSKALYDSYFAEYCIRRKYLDSSADKFLQFLSVIRLVYKPKQLARPIDAHISGADQHTAAAQEPLREQADCQHSTQDDVASNDWRSVDIGNFDLKFDFSDDCDDDIFA